MRFAIPLLVAATLLLARPSASQPAHQWCVEAVEMCELLDSRRSNCTALFAKCTSQIGLRGSIKSDRGGVDVDALVDVALNGRVDVDRIAEMASKAPSGSGASKPDVLLLVADAPDGAEAASKVSSGKDARAADRASKRASRRPPSAK